MCIPSPLPADTIFAFALPWLEWERIVFAWDGNVAAALCPYCTQPFPLVWTYRPSLLITMSDRGDEVREARFISYSHNFFLRQLPCKGCRGGNETISECARIFWCERCKHDTTYPQKSCLILSLHHKNSVRSTKNSFFIPTSVA